MSSPEKRDHPGELFVLPVRTAEDLECFISVTWSIYEDDPCRVPPLIVERKEHLSAKNPYFEHARWQAWAVFRKNKPMGRISAQVDQLRLETYGDGTGLFGFLEADDFPAIFGLPLGWLKLLWRLKRHKLKTARVTLMGVRLEYHNSALGIALGCKAVDAFRLPATSQGVNEVEMSWILEDNSNMRHILESLGGDPCKRNRIYQKEL